MKAEADMGAMTMMAVALAAAVLTAGCALTGGAAAPAAPADWRAEVMAAERAFAGTMAQRDHAAFTGFLAEEAVFFTDGGPPLRGKQAVAAGWQPFFEGAAAPFAWRPDQVEVLQSGTLALSTGPVLDPSGRVVGRFNSIWRREAPGVWRIVFDKGSPVCPPEAPTP